jgi:excisionase family DNA binding protein
MKTYSTEEAANLAGVTRVTLYRWLLRGMIQPTIAVELKGMTLRRWTKADVEKAKKLKGQLRPGRKAKGH